MRTSGSKNARDGIQNSPADEPLPSILVVDDSHDSANILGSLFDAHGYKTYVAYDWEAALETARAHLPDVILLDLGMPGMDGIHLARFFREDEQLNGKFAAQAKLAETIKTAETLRKKLESDNAQLIATAAELELVTKAAAKTKADLVVAQKTLTDAKLAKSQAELATAQKALAETKQALTENQAELAQAAKARETLAKEVAAEKAQSIATAAKLDLASKEAARANAELAATQKTLMETTQAKSQKELATNQKTLAETRQAADELRKSLEAEIKNSVARLEEANREADLIRKESDAAAAKLVLTNKDAARTKADLNAAQKTLALQPHLPVTVVVTLPADAQLTFDNRPTISTGGRREFHSPPLEVGSTFYYTLKAQVMREGKMVTMEKQIEFRAGERIEVSLTVPATQTIGQP